MNPLSGIYGGVSALRNALFDRGALATRRLERPVVSVGNLSVGGSGKTPFVIALGELLKARGVPFDVLSRGYRRKTRGVMIVEPEGSAADFGDEPLLIARRLGVPVIVGESRYEAGRVAEKQFDAELHILDDGFQHRRLARDFDIVLLTGDEFDGRLLPAGRLRESLVSLKRADAIVLPFDVPIQNSVAQGKLLWKMKREITVEPKPIKPVAFCGIARPRQFFAQLRAAGIAPAEEVALRDHHAYTRADVERLQEARKKASADGFVTTEKDAINLGPLQAELTPLALAALNVSFPNPADIVDTIVDRIRERSRQS